MGSTTNTTERILISMIKMRIFNNYSNWDIVDFVRYDGGYIPVHAKLRLLLKYEKGTTMPVDVVKVFLRMIDLDGVYKNPYSISDANSNHFLPSRIRLLK